MAEREQGTVKWFSSSKGYGFITPEEGDDIFCHFSSLAGDGYRTLKENDKVEFEVGTTDKGKEAKNVEKIS